MMGKRSTSAQRKEPDAVVVAFPVRSDAGVLAAVPREQPVAPAMERGSFRLAIVLSLALHAAAFAALQSWTENDLERALGNAAMPAAEGTVVVIPVEVVADSALPSAAAPTNTTTPEAQTPNPTEMAEPEKPEPATRPVVDSIPSAVPPPPLAAEAPAEERLAPLPDAKAPDWRMVEEKPAPKPVEMPRSAEERPVEEKTAPKEVRRTEARPAAPSAAAAPVRPAASATPGRVGNRGNIETGGAALVSSYQAQVQAHLQRFRTYPEAARSRGITGVATVRFALERNGQVLSVSLVRGSGAGILDEAALAMVRRASPFPSFPAGLSRARMDFAAPMRFDLR
jgi:periplasmic protein TonB